jgi:glycosyltransferase involved in cell wall biosynthesis
MRGAWRSDGVRDGRPSARASSRTMRIGYECTAVVEGRSGVGHYAERLGRALASVAPGDVEVVALTNGEPLPSLRNAPPTGPKRPRALWLNVAVRRLARRLDLDLFHFTANVAPMRFGDPYVLTVHDVTTRRAPETHPPRRRAYYRAALGASARNARRVITVSETSAADIVAMLGVPRDRIDVIPLAPDSRFRRVEDRDALGRLTERYGLDEPYLLYVGNIEPRKNLGRLLEAYARVGRISGPLVLVGNLAWLTREVVDSVNRLGLTERVRFLGYVPDSDLPALYSAASAFVYPSLFEGFGLPVIEAMACGAAVVTSTAPALREIAEGAALLVDPYSVESIAEGIRTVLTGADVHARLVESGLARASRYTWEATARRTLETYARALHPSGAITPELA